MQQLYTKLPLVILMLLGNQLYIHAMEVTTDKSRVPSLKDICLDYIGTHLQEVNAIPNLGNIPDDLAYDIVIHTPPSFLGEHKDALISLIDKKELDHTILSSIASKLCLFKIGSAAHLGVFLLAIEDIMTGLKNGNVNYGELAKFNRFMPFISDSKLMLSLKKELVTFNELVIKIDANQTTIGKLMQVKEASMPTNDSESSNKHIERLAERSKELLEKVFAQANTCTKEINALQAYTSTLCIQSLVQDIAKNGPLSFYLAEKMRIDFMNTNIPDNFDNLFNHYFPEEIVNGNDKSFHMALAELPLCPSYSLLKFPVEEFDKQICAQLKIIDYPWVEITYTTNKKHAVIIPGFSTDGQAEILTTIINPKHNIVLIHLKETPTRSGEIHLININNLMHLSFNCPEEAPIEKIGLNTDCTQLGIMLKDGSITSFALPTELLTYCPSVKERAFLTYLHEKMWDILQIRLPNFAGRDLSAIAIFVKQNYTNIPFRTLRHFLDFVTINKHLIPQSLYEAIYSRRITELVMLGTLCTMVALVSKKLNLSIETLCDKIISHEITPEAFMEIFDEVKLSMDKDMATLTSEERKKKTLDIFFEIIEFR